VTEFCFSQTPIVRDRFQITQEQITDIVESDGQVKMRLQEQSTLVLFLMMVESHTQGLCCFVFLLTSFFTGTQLSMLVPMSLIVYALLEFKRAPKCYWFCVVVMTQFIMCMKFIYQLRFFCLANDTHNPEFFFYSIQPDARCLYDETLDNKMRSRTDWLFGIYKGGGSFSTLVFMNVLCLICVAIHERAMRRKGVWDLSEHKFDSTLDDYWIHYKQYRRRKFEHDRTGSDYYSILQSYRYRIWRSFPEPITKYYFALCPPNVHIKPDRSSYEDHNILHTLKPGRDYYTQIFCLQFVSILYAGYFFEDLASNIHISSITTALNFDMVLVLFFQTMIAVWDRSAYLLRSLKLKLLLQYFTVVYFNYLIFWKWPKKKAVGFLGNPHLMFYFLLKCAYWLISCFQIRSGYPTFDRHHSRLTRVKGYYRGVVFRIYKAIPFLFELKTLLDWVCTTTALDITELLKVEDMYGTLFIIQCNNIGWKEYRKRGQPMYQCYKIYYGAGIFLLLLALLLGPLFLFSSKNPSYTSNDIEQASVFVQLEGLQDMGTVSIVEITNFAKENVEPHQVHLTNQVDPRSQTVQKVQMNPYADAFWAISPPVERTLINTLHTSTSVALQLKWEFERKGPRGQDQSRSLSTIAPLAGTDAKGTLSEDEKQALLLTLTNGTRYRVSRPIHTYWHFTDNDPYEVYPNGKIATQDLELMFRKEDTDPFGYWSLGNVTNSTHNGIDYVIVLDKYIGQQFLDLSGLHLTSIFALYSVIIFSIGSIVRSQCTNSVKDIPTKDLLGVELLYRLVEAIKLANVQGNLYLEEQLFRVLVRIYRDPNLMIKLTRRRPESEEAVEELAMSPANE